MGSYQGKMVVNTLSLGHICNTCH